jgi:DsbC/DsbD-like thiol-disulfide interchange protein
MKRMHMIPRCKQSLLVFVLAIAAIPTCRAQDSHPHPIQWSLTASAATLPLRDGLLVQGTLHAKIQPGWHLYALDQLPGGPTATRISLPASRVFTLNGSIEADTAPLMANDPNFDLETRYYEGDASFRIPVRVTSSAGAAQAKLAVDVLFQSCSDHLCLPPMVVHLSAQPKQGR